MFDIKFLIGLVLFVGLILLVRFLFSKSVKKPPPGKGKGKLTRFPRTKRTKSHKRNK